MKEKEERRKRGVEKEGKRNKGGKKADPWLNTSQFTHPTSASSKNSGFASVKSPFPSKPLTGLLLGLTLSPRFLLLKILVLSLSRRYASRISPQSPDLPRPSFSFSEDHGLAPRQRHTRAPAFSRIYPLPFAFEKEGDLQDMLPVVWCFVWMLFFEGRARKWLSLSEIWLGTPCAGVPEPATSKFNYTQPQRN